MYSIYSERRRRLMEAVGEGILILPAASLALRNADTHYPYRQDSYFYYLTGFNEPEAMLVLEAGSGKSILFCREQNVERDIWDGFCHGTVLARDTFGFDEAYPIERVDQLMLDILSDQKHVYWNIGRVAAFDARLMSWLQAARAGARTGGEFPIYFGDVLAWIDEMRLIKDESEMMLLRRAGRISAEAHIRAMQATRAAKYEYQIECEILHTFIRQGARYPSYESIVASGANACTLHYNNNCARLNNGELLLIDAGCELQNYASDISRTFPINGKFTAVQRDVYEIVLAAQKAAIAAVAPGASWVAPGDAALQVLVQGMVDLTLLAGSVEGIIESGAYRQFYMHGIGHMLGLDVHDVGKRKVDGQWRTYKVGMCTTIEPGLYIRPAANVPDVLSNIGIRIEDDVLVTASGCEVYTAAVPKEIEDIEALMRDT